MNPCPCVHYAHPVKECARHLTSRRSPSPGYPAYTENEVRARAIANLQKVPPLIRDPVLCNASYEQPRWLGATT